MEKLIRFVAIAASLLVVTGFAAFGLAACGLIIGSLLGRQQVAKPQEQEVSG